MKRIWLKGTLVCAIGALLALTMGAQKDDHTEKIGGHDAVANEVLIKFRDASLQDIEVAKMRGGIVHAKKIGGIGVYRFRSGDKGVATLIELFAGDPGVEYVEPNYILHADGTPADPLYSQLWGMEMIDAPSAWDVWTDSTAVTVGVVDTGVDYTHPDLAANVWSAPFDFTVEIGGSIKTCPAGKHGYNAIRETFDPKDDNDHGTHVSGTIGAVGNNGVGVAGVNWKASIMGLKFLNSQGSGDTADAVDAIEFAIQAKIAGAANVRVLSNSWSGGRPSRTLLEEIERAYANDILFVCSAGNYGRVLRNEYPSTYSVPNIIAVAASNENDCLADFSNFGAWSVHLAAPGVNVLSTVRRAGYDVYDGTSMAAPHVSGVAALVASKTGADVDRLRGILINSAEFVNVAPPGDGTRNIFENTITNGRLNALAAITADPAGPGALFPDFTVRFDAASKDAKKGAVVYIDLALKSYHGYAEGQIWLEKECCGPIFPTFADVTDDPNPPDAAFVYPFVVPLAAGQEKKIRMRVQVPATAKPGASYGFTLRAVDYKETGEAGPCLYHNDTAFVVVVR
jgi:subtilisin family serine protease